MKTYHRWIRKHRRRFLIESLRDAAGNASVAAGNLGIHRNTLSRLMKEDGITPAVLKAVRTEAATSERRIYQK